MGVDIVLILAAYLLGALPFGFLLTRLRTGKDIRNSGSGNIGATNVLRTQGAIWGLLTLVLDFGKGFAAVLFCAHFGSAAWMGAAGGAAAVVGHCFPVYIGFRGGKGIATGLGAFVLIAPGPTLLALAVFIVSVVLFRLVSLGSIFASLSFGAALLVRHLARGAYDPWTVALGILIAILLVGRHHRNIARILKGTEEPLWGKKP
ncbi:MAG: glycerol-3-phosphate 1-O-acyltransferase PlsY [Acidobacteriota bacterium]|jgi:acyl phosphate:glycerol-3-phosphate acyltransferase